MNKKKYFKGMLLLALIIASSWLMGCGSEQQEPNGTLNGTGMPQDGADTGVTEDQNEALEIVVDSIEGESEGDDDPGLDELGL